MSDNPLSAQAERLHLARTGKNANWYELVRTMNEIHVQEKYRADIPVAWIRQAVDYLNGVPGTDLPDNEDVEHWLAAYYPTDK